MRALFVVFEHPPEGGLSYLIEVSEQVNVEDFVTVSPVEPLDIAVLIGLAGLDVPNGHATRRGPFRESLAQEFRSVVDAKDLRKPSFSLNLFEDPDEPYSRQRCVDFDVDGFTVEIVDDVEGPKTPAAVKGVAHEIRRPDLVWLLRNRQGPVFPWGQLTLGPALLVEPHGAVHPIDPFVVPAVALSAQDLEALPKAPLWPLFDQVIESGNQGRISLLLCHRLTVIGRPRKPHAAATAGDRKTVLIHQELHRLPALGRL